MCPGTFVSFLFCMDNVLGFVTSKPALRLLLSVCLVFLSVCSCVNLTKIGPDPTMLMAETRETNPYKIILYLCVMCVYCKQSIHTCTACMDSFLHCERYNIFLWNFIWKLYMDKRTDDDHDEKCFWLRWWWWCLVLERIAYTEKYVYKSCISVYAYFFVME